MIAFDNEVSESTWQRNFAAILPDIEQKLGLAFCRLRSEAREDAVEEGVVHCLLAYVRLYDQGREDVTTASSLAWYAAKHIKRGRPAVGRMNGKDPLSRYGQITNGILVDRQRSNWIDVIVEDKRAAVADLVAARLDVGAWLMTLTKRLRQVARDLAFGCTTAEVAAKQGVTAGRISQFRRTLEDSWRAFQQEAASAVA